MIKNIKIVFLVMTIIFLAAACNTGKPDNTNKPRLSIETSSSPVLSPTDEQNDPETVPVLLKLYIPEQKVGLNFMDYYSGFTDIIKEKFNIELESEFGGMTNFYDTSVLSNDIFYLNSGLHFERRIMMETDAIIPFSDYLNDSRTWQEMPDVFKQAHMDGEGNVWAISYNDTPIIWARSIAKDWFEKTGLEIPKTVVELYNLLQTFTYGDPDGDGADDTYGASLSDKDMVLMSFKDIFEANGCYLAYSCIWDSQKRLNFEYSLMGYNPKTGMIEDSLKNPGFMQSLETIESMAANGFIDPKVNTMTDGKMLDNNIGTYLGPIYENLLYPAKYEYCYSLEGTSTEDTATVLYGDNNLYYLSKYSKDPNMAVPAFIEIMFGSVESYKLMRYGPLGKGSLYAEENGVIVKNDENEKLASHIELIGDISWLKEQLSVSEELPPGTERLNVETLMKDDNMLPLSHIHMSILEYSHERPGNEEIALLRFYKREISDVGMLFLTGSINAEEFYNELASIHARYDVDDWLDDVNQRWLGVN